MNKVTEWLDYPYEGVMFEIIREDDNITINRKFYGDVETVEVPVYNDIYRDAVESGNPITQEQWNKGKSPLERWEKMKSIHESKD